MATPNLDLVRSIYASWERGDYSSTEWAHPDIEFTRPDGPAPGRWIGVAAMAEGWKDVLAAWENFRSEAQEYRELDGERVLVFVHVKGRGRASGLDVGEAQAKAATVFHVRDGKVTRLFVYGDRERALADLGLAQEGDTA
jgi:ketosteroid isomerase-like protein